MTETNEIEGAAPAADAQDGESAPAQGLRLKAGMPIVIYDRRRREYYDVLQPDRTSNMRGDRIPHEALIGQPDGARFETPKGRIFRVFAATIVQQSLNMKRHATIIYPKDIGPILMWGDIYPGATVVEGGFGSGALSMALLRAIGESGRLITYENRESSANTARKNVAAMLGGEPANHEVRLADIYEGIDAVGVDRVVLDVPEPWQVVPHAAECLRDGGILVAYVPTTLQLQQFALAVREHKAFATTECMEVMLRGWYVTRQSVRPEQQMVGHTGFLAFSRRAARPPEMVAEAAEARATEASATEGGATEAGATEASAGPVEEG